jgi:hypothetical protein
MVFKPPAFDRVLWQATFDENASNVDVYLSHDVDKYIIPPLTSPLDQILLMYALISLNGLLIHGAGAGIHGHGMVFTGQSGSGKSTLATLLSGCGGVEILSDERTVIRMSGDSLRIFGTPWHSSAALAGNGEFPFKALFFIHHGPESRIIPCPSVETLKRLLPLMVIPWYDPYALPRVLDVCSNLTLSVPCYDFYVKPDFSAIDAIEKFVEDLTPPDLPAQ